VDDEIGTHLSQRPRDAFGVLGERPVVSEHAESDGRLRRWSGEEGEDPGGLSAGFDLILVTSPRPQAIELRGVYDLALP
jgi:hypothetical protein